MFAEAEAVDPAPDPGVGFVVPKTKNGKHRKLHAVEFCRLIPGIQWTEHGGFLPDSKEFESMHSICMPSAVE